MKKLLLLMLTAGLLVSGCSDDSATGPGTFTEINDDFGDGVLDPSTWNSGGDITESGGTLHLDRETPDDFIETVQTYSGDYVITLETKLNSIHWNDMYHGISIRSSTGDGVSMGYSKYGKLYVAAHESSLGGGTSTSYDYGPDNSNQAGQWLTWVITRTGSTVSVTVNGAPVTGFDLTLSVPNSAKISLPGLYQDGDGGGPIGVTASEVASFSITR